MDSEPPKIFLGIPNYGEISNQTWDAVLDAVRTNRVYAWRESWSLLAHCFNKCLEKCVNMGGFAYFGMIHADMGANSGWMEVLVEEMEAGDFDVIHAPAAIKNGDGLTSTALAYSDDEWGVVRRLTTSELRQLPPTFGVGDVNSVLGTDAKYLLPNTGCMLVKLGDWINDFTGFHVQERFWIADGEADTKVVPEDWQFGFWCGKRGMNVGATTKVTTKHKGHADYCNDRSWGVHIDTHWVDKHKVIA